MLTIFDLKPGDCARISGYHRGRADYRQKLLSMGLTPGTIFKVVRCAPFGDPIHISLRNFCLALRKKEALLIKIEKIDDA